MENLYFHHSHQRGPKPYLTSSTLPAATQNDTLVSSSSKFSDSSYKSWLDSLSRSSTLDTVLDGSSQENSSGGDSLVIGAPTPAGPPFQTSLGPQNMSNVPSILLTSAETSSAQASQNSNTLAQTPTGNLQFTSSSQNGYTAADSSTVSNLSTQAASVVSTSLPAGNTSVSALPQQPAQLPTSLPFTNGSPSPTPVSAASTPVSASKTKKPSLGHRNATSLTAKDMLNFNSTSLTYDSFWSGLQSKSYPTLKNGASPMGPGTSTGSFSNTTTANTANVSVPNQPSAQNPASTLIPPSTPSFPSAVSYSQTLSTSGSTTPSTTPTPTPSLPPLPTTSAPAPVSILPATSAPQAQVEMQMQNRPFTDYIAAWSFGASAQQPGIPTNLIPASLLANPAAFPFLANLSASYVNAGGGQNHAPGAGIGGVGVNADGAGPGTTNPVAPAGVPVSTPAPAPPVVSAFVGQQES